MFNIISAHTKIHIIKYKYGVKVPKRFKEAIKYYKENSNTLWKYMIGKEMAQNKYFRILKPLKRGTKAPDNPLFFTSSHFFYINFYLRRKAQLVKGLYMTGSSHEDVYCGVIKINTFRTAFFLGQINDLEVAVVDVGNAWLHELTKKNIYTVAKPCGVVRHIVLYHKGLGLKSHPPSPPRAYTG